MREDEFFLSMTQQKSKLLNIETVTRKRERQDTLAKLHLGTHEKLNMLISI